MIVIPIKKKKKQKKKISITIISAKNLNNLDEKTLLNLYVAVVIGPRRKEVGEGEKDKEKKERGERVNGLTCNNYNNNNITHQYLNVRQKSSGKQAILLFGTKN